MDIKKRVLVVDDEPAIVRFVKVNLSLSGYDVFTASGGAEALKLIQENPPDIVLLDLVMAPMNGFTVLEKLRSYSKLPVVAFSARNDSAELALQKGADAFLRKPFKPEKLTEVIEATLKNASQAGTPQ